MYQFVDEQQAKNNQHIPNLLMEPSTPKKMPVMLALFDVLGFKNWLELVGIDTVLAKYQDLITTAVLKPPQRCLGLAGELQGPQHPVLFTLTVQYAYFSDTILLWLPLQGHSFHGAQISFAMPSR
jgi:hypothetical protein